MPDKVYRTAIYCRLSREDGDKVESNSIASQRAICEDYIARHDDLELVCEPFVDDGYSGVSFNRPQFKKLEAVSYTHLKKVGGGGIRYTVQIRGKESFLFREGDKWFVERCV